MFQSLKSLDLYLFHKEKSTYELAFQLNLHTIPVAKLNDWIAHLISNYSSFTDTEAKLCLQTTSENVINVILYESDLKKEKARAKKKKLLSIREWEIVELLLLGKTEKEIAEKLRLALYTVQSHRKNIYRKLKIISKSELFETFVDKHQGGHK